MTYPGTSSLAAEIRQRILTTFQQTLELASQGKTHEALLGCDFILRLDSAFEPARALMARLGEATGGAAVETSDLRQMVAGGPAPQAARPPAPAAGGAGSAPAGEAARAAPVLSSTGAVAVGNALAAGLKDLLDRRELKRLVQIADESRQEVAANPELRKIVEAAYARLEAEPYVKSFLDSARVALQTGDLAETERLLAKARSLDPTHPGIAEIEQARTFYEDPSRQIGGRRRTIAVEEETASAAGVPERDPDVVQGFDLFPEEASPSFGASIAPPSPEAGSSPAATAFGGPARGDGRIAELLEEGQAAFSRADYQAAIDSWSRVFLIDIDHQEAARRIDQARRLKSEGERRAEELYHDALTSLEAGDRDAAEAGLKEVLEIMPGHLAARESLEQLERGDAPVGGLAPEPAPAIPAAPRRDLKEEILVPPDRARPRRAPTAAPPPVAPAKKAQPGRRFAMIGGLVLLVAVGVAGFLWLRWDDMFPNSKSEAEGPAPAADPIARATAAHEQGRTNAAVRQLRLLPPDHPRYAEAQQLIAQWESPAAEPEAAPDEPAQPSPEGLARRDREIELARQAYAQGEYLLADARFRRAAQIAPLDGTAGELAIDARQQLEPLKLQLELFEQGDWAMALHDLWRMHEAKPGDKDVVRLMVDSYYNLAVRELQRGNPGEAVTRFDEALALRPESEVLKRHRRFAETYTQRPQDLLYRIYVRYLPLL